MYHGSACFTGFPGHLQSLVRRPAKLPDETEWVELKCNNKQHQMIGEYISALSNSAALCEVDFSFKIFVSDNFIGFQPISSKNPFFHKIIENSIIEPHTNRWMSRSVIRSMVADSDIFA